MQRTKVVWGVDGTATDTSATNPLPVKTESGSQVKVTALEGEPNVKVANEPTVKIAASQTVGLVAGTAEIGKVKVTELPALPTGTNAIGKVTVTSLEGEPKVKVATIEGEPKVKLGGELPAGTQAIGKVTVSSLEGEPKVKLATGQALSVTPQAEGGLLIKRVLAEATTNATSVKAEKGQVYGWYIFNTSAAIKYVKLYNKASAPTVGTDTPVMTIPVPKESGTNIEYVNGIAFGTGIALATTKALADNSSEAVAANDLVINLLYK